MQRVFVIRHGLRIDTEDRTWRETAARPHDPPLSATGRRQAFEVGAYLRDRGVAAAYTSPFLRTLQTAQGIYDASGIPFRVEPAMGEWLRPQWFPTRPLLYAPEEIRREFSGYDASYRSATVVAYPEELEEVAVYERVRAFLAWLDDVEPGVVALVGHGASVTQAVRALCGHTEGLDAQLCSITELERADGAWRNLGSSVKHLSTTGG